jgi:hypothetical protein
MQQNTPERYHRKLANTGLLTLGTLCDANRGKPGVKARPGKNNY